jgi:hypothetical protein
MLEKFKKLNLMHVMDDSLTYIDALSSQYEGNLDLFLEKTRSKIEKGKLN